MTKWLISIVRWTAGHWVRREGNSPLIGIVGGITILTVVLFLGWIRLCIVDWVNGWGLGVLGWLIFWGGIVSVCFLSFWLWCVVPVLILEWKKAKRAAEELAEAAKAKRTNEANMAFLAEMKTELDALEADEIAPSDKTQ